jgi:hypothetical protein
MIPDGILRLVDGTYEVWCCVQDGHEHCGVYKQRRLAARRWAKAHAAYNGVTKDPSDVPIYVLKTDTVTHAERVF